MKPSDIESHVRCIDLDQPVEVVQIPPGGFGPKGAIMVQHGVPGSDSGACYAPNPRTSAEQLGVWPTAMPMEGGKPKGPVVDRDTREIKRDPSEPVVGLKCTAAVGGGVQILVPDPSSDAPQRIHSQATFHEVLDEALTQTSELAAADPSWPLPHLIQEQLELMRATTDAGAAPDEKQRLSTDVGPIAVRNFEGSNDAYADLLKELDYAFRRYDALL